VGYDINKVQQRFKEVLVLRNVCYQQIHFNLGRFKPLKQMYMYQLLQVELMQAASLLPSVRRRENNARNATHGNQCACPDGRVSNRAAFSVFLAWTLWLTEVENSFA
jgi:hypothetical protein